MMRSFQLFFLLWLKLNIFYKASGDVPRFSICSSVANHSMLPYDYRRSAPAIYMALEYIALNYGDYFTIEYIYVDRGTDCSAADMGAIASRIYTQHDVVAFIGPVVVTNSTWSYDYRRSASAIHMALEYVALIYGDYFTIEYIYVDRGTDCSATDMGAIASRIYTQYDVAAFIGPGCSFAVEVLGYMASSWNLPLITPVGTKSSLSNKVAFSTLTRLSYDMSKFAKFYRTLFTYFRWKHVAVLYDLDNIFSKIVGLSLHPDFESNGVMSKEFPYNSGQTPNYYNILEKASKVARVMIMTSGGDTMRQMMIAAQEKGMTNGEYSFIFIRLFDGDDVGDSSWERDDALDEIAREAYQAVLTVTLAKPSSVEFHNFTREVRQRALDEYNYDYGEAEVNNFIVGFYDAFLVYAKALNDTLAEGGDPLDGRAMTMRMWNNTYEGMSGRIAIDENGDRETDFSLLDMDPRTGQFRVVGNYFGSNRSFSLVSSAPIHWPNDMGVPPDVPECGFLGDEPKCNPYVFPAYGIISLAFLGVILIIIAIGVFIYRRMKLESDLESNWWRVKWEEIYSHSRSVMRSFLSTSRAEAHSSSVTAADAQIMFTKVAMHKGNLVSVKKLPLKSISINREIKIELKQMRDLSHPNLVKFIGISLDSPSIVILTEFCQKGSLQDILSNSSIQLDWEFKLSLLNDICEGVSYLHQSSLGIHGYLTSYHCVIDSRFVLKLTDYGLLSLRNMTSKLGSRQDRMNMWAAPEHLRCDGNSISQKGDVYSLGIITYEIVTRLEPYEMELSELESKEIIDLIKAESNPPFRPSLKGIDCKKELKQLIELCWEEDPERRPSVHAVTKTVKSIGGRESNLLDTLLRRMENYANNLEQLVDERTNAFLEEKKKSEHLLYQVLPKSVADQLKNGKTVEPEAFDCVTIYFSDICGFTNISAESTPIQVIDLLNDLYTCFDSTIDTFDVYKVETIGDAYMVVSGLPLRNGNEHAREIALMSLAILKRVEHFKIRHKPGIPLQARIGVHSGPVCSGVVGLKMPRYCLFGDTVNTASRMESHGQALKIHTSESTKVLLDAIGGFYLEERGEITIKGKGIMKTYWLTGTSLKTEPIPENT